MKIYHGTDAKNVESIFINGITPRSIGNRPQPKSSFLGDYRTTWPSNKNLVYLTENHAPYYGLIRNSQYFAVCEIVTSGELNQDLLRPDQAYMVEETLHRTNGSHDAAKIAKEIIESHDEYAVYAGRSLQRLGSLGYEGTIPPAFIPRIATLRWTDAPELCAYIREMEVSTFNHAATAHIGTAITRWMFGDIVDIDELMPLPTFRVEDNVRKLIDTQRKKAYAMFLHHKAIIIDNPIYKEVSVSAPEGWE